MFTFKQLEAFYWTVKLGSLSAAGKKLFTSQSSISKRIQEIEKRFDVTLFIRGQQIILTNKGQEIFHLSEKIIAQKNQLVQKLSDSKTYHGVFRLGLTEITAISWLPKFIKETRIKHPNLTIKPVIDLASNLNKDLLEGKLDMIISNQNITKGHISSILLDTVHFNWYASPLNFDTKRKYSTADIASLTLIRQDKGSGLNKLYDEWLNGYSVKTNIFTINSIFAMAALVAAGCGVCCLPTAYFQHMVLRKQIAPLYTEKMPPTTNYYVIHRDDIEWENYDQLIQIMLEVVDFSYSYYL